MPSTTPLGKYRIPLGSESNDAASFMSQFGLDIDPHTVLWATSVSDRDTQYGGAALPVGGVVSCAALKTLWIKIATTGGTQWATVYSDSGWVTTGFSNPTTGWAASTTKIRNLSGQVELRMAIPYSGSDITLGTTGNISPDVPIGQVPSGWQPSDTIEVNGALNGGGCAVAVNTSGQVILESAMPGTTITSGTSVRVTGTWFLG